MKNTIILFSLLMSSAACQKATDEVMTTQQAAINSDLTGLWVLKETFYGFSNTRIAGSGYDYMEFMNNGRYVETYSKAIRDQGSYAVENSTMQGDNRKIIRYPERKEYQFYWFDNGKLNLYQKAPDGATLADGAVYVYEKVR